MSIKSKIRIRSLSIYLSMGSKPLTGRNSDIMLSRCDVGSRAISSSVVEFNSEGKHFKESNPLHGVVTHTRKSLCT